MDTPIKPTRKTHPTPEDQAWQMVTGQLRAQLDRNTFDAYIRDTQVVDLTGGTLTIAAPSAYARDWMASRLTTTIQRHAEPLFGQPVVVRFIFAEPEENDLPQQDEEDGFAWDASAETVETSGSSWRGSDPEPAEGPEKKQAFRVADDWDAPKALGTVENDAYEVVLEEKQAKTPPASTAQAAGNAAQIHANTPAAVGDGGLAAAADAPTRSVKPNFEAGVRADRPAAAAVIEPEEDDCAPVLIQEVADTVEAALLQPGRIVAFPRYELRHIPLVGPEAFFLRLAFLQERFLNTTADGRARPFETTVESLLRWANVGRATLHRFKKGDPARGQQPAAGWFGIEQLPSAPRTANSQQQPPCRYRLQQGIPLTPMDADRLYDLLTAAGIQDDPLPALESLIRRPVQEILPFPPPAPSEEQKKRAPVFTTVPGVVQSAMGNKKLPPDLRSKVQEAAGRLADHITNPGQVVFVSWYFLRHWLPLLGHDAAALVLVTRAQGYYNPQEHELRDEIQINGGYSELAQVIGLKRDRTIGDWLPNIFDRQEPGRRDESEKWQREQQRQQQTQARIGQFIQVIPGTRRKTAEGHYAFNLRVQIAAEPLTPTDQTLRAWVYQTLAACVEADVLEHFHAWVTSPALFGADQNDGAGILGVGEEAHTGDGSTGSLSIQNDGWGILAAREWARNAQEMTARESAELDDDGWGILASILDDGRGILARSEMTVGELFKGLLRLNTFWETLLKTVKTSSTQPEHEGTGEKVVVKTWDLREICMRNGGINKFREQIIAHEPSAEPFMSWLCYAYSFKGRGIEDPVGWVLSRLHDQAGSSAGGVFDRLSALPPSRLARLLQTHLESGAPPMEDDWHFAFRDAPAARLRQMAEVLGIADVLPA